MVMGFLGQPLLRQLLSLSLLSLSTAQFISTGTDANVRNLTIVRSPADDNITVSYTQPEGVCKTAFDTQKQYTGWVNVPGDYQTNLFFWFVEAREKTDRLTIWLNGGPGSSSLYGFFDGNGPCEVIEQGKDAFDTAAREWGWDRASNMLFIDQPNQVGFSYDVPTNGTLYYPHESTYVPPISTENDPDKAWQARNGTFSSLSGNHTANTTQIASMAVWHMIQGFFDAFPQYKSASNGSVPINLFAESYGGRYGPIFAETFFEQNDKRRKGLLPRNTTLELKVQALGIINGCVDPATQMPEYPRFANQNSYGYKALSDKEAELYGARFREYGGCKDLLDQCLAGVKASDPEGEGDEEDVNTVCSKANQVCNSDMSSPYYDAGRSAYDLSAPFADPFPPFYFLEYLNQPQVQRAIGAVTNFTMSSVAVGDEFGETGDRARGGDVDRLATLLRKGVKIGLMYGDRDYICNWFGGEAVSKGIAAKAGDAYAKGFTAAGYAPIVVNESYVGGEVRQFGNLSFSRIYQAGHSVASYQPETAFEVFARIIMGTSVSTGEGVDLSSFGTEGPANSTHTDDLPPMAEPTCFVRAFYMTCDEDAYNIVNNGGGVVINGVLYESAEDWPGAQGTQTSSKTTASATEVMTGVFTATETPDTDDGDSAGSRAAVPWHVWILSCSAVLGLLS